jgi:magnesium transporter
MASSGWIDLLDPSPAELRSALPAEVEEIVSQRLNEPVEHDDEPRPRLEAHGNYVFGVLVIPVVGAGETRYQEVDVVLTEERLLTIRKSTPDVGAFSCDQAMASEDAKDALPGMCLYVLVDEIAERYLTVIDQFDDRIDELEDKVESWQAATIRQRISDLRHDILHVRRVLAPTRDLARSILDDRVELDEGDLFPREVNIRFADTYDKLLRATDGLDLSRDLLAGVRDYHQAQVANDQNEVMKRLTVIASVLLLPTFIVGLYGQNLKGIPELRFHYGYLWSWMLIIVTTIAQIVYFRRKGWI